MSQSLFLPCFPSKGGAEGTGQVSFFMSYYFPHDYDAMSDDKLLQVRGEYGLEGYALFWMCLETMAKNENGHIKTNLIGGLSLGYGLAKERLLAYLEFCREVDLFQYDKERGYSSKRMLDHHEYVASLSKNGKLGALKRWGKQESDSPPNDQAIATPLAPLMQIKENKIKEKKIREPDSEGESVAIAPTPSQMAAEFFTSDSSQEELVTRFKEKGYEENLVRKEIKKFVSYWTEPNSTGKRQRWQMEKTFELSRRLSTWLGKAGNQQQSFIKPSQQWHAI